MSSLYERLGETYIRLLAVSVEDGEVASLELITWPRTAAPEYDAVSYTWGDNISTTSTVCNGISLDIRTNLLRALPFIHDCRPEPSTRPLWIDAICLNQNDDEEKAMHVPRMNEVYINASRTLIWLGEAAADSDLAMDNIESLTQKLLTVKDRTLTVSQTLTRYDLPLINDPKWDAIKNLQLRPWFYRLWTMQEIVLSKNAVLLCGRKTTTWNALVSLHAAAEQANLTMLINAQAKPETPYKDAQVIVTYVDEIQKRIETRNDVTLPALIFMSADRGYSMPVDRIWALIGMLNKNYRQMIVDAKLVDYSEAAISRYHETFLAIVKFHVQHDRFLARQLIEDNSQTVRNTELPSWCPDWHANSGDFPLSRWPGALTGFPGGQFRRIQPFMQVNDDSSLEIDGLVVDIIERTTASAGQIMFELEGYPWLIECEEIIKSTSFVPYDVYPATADIPTIPTTLADGPPISEEHQQYQRAAELLRYTLYPPGLLLESSSRTMLNCNGRKFFRTKASRLGIGPAHVEENDILCAMHGARTLWALRPLQSPETARDPEFELIGSAYTPSLLNGEAWAGKSLASMQRFKLR